jgi:hypothetical protein
MKAKSISLFTAFSREKSGGCVIDIFVTKGSDFR